MTNLDALLLYVISFQNTCGACAIFPSTALANMIHGVRTWYVPSHSGTDVIETSQCKSVKVKGNNFATHSKCTIFRSQLSLATNEPRKVTCQMLCRVSYYYAAFFLLIFPPNGLNCFGLVSCVAEPMNGMELAKLHTKSDGLAEWVFNTCVSGYYRITVND